MSYGDLNFIDHLKFIQTTVLDKFEKNSEAKDLSRIPHEKPL